MTPRMSQAEPSAEDSCLLPPVHDVRGSASARIESPKNLTDPHGAEALSLLIPSTECRPTAFIWQHLAS